MSRVFQIPNSLKVSRPPKGLFILLMSLLVPLLIAACGGYDPTAVPQAAAATDTPQPPPAAATLPAPDPTDTPAPPPTSPPAPQATSTPANTPVPQPTATPVPPAPASNTVEVSSQGSLGQHLVDGNGMTLYLFTNDERNISNCSGGCAGAWPPLSFDGDPEAGESVNADRLATIQRDDGSSQVTYNGKPLFYFANDENPGDTIGQDRGGVWFVVSPDGGPVFTRAPVNASVNAALGTILTDGSARSLYLFTKDERNVSNCAGGCALAWPPLITVDDPAPGEGLAEDRIGTISRGGGAKQVTYNGWPVYYFAADEKPGDAKGQDRGGVCFVLSTDGGPVFTSAPVNASVNTELGTILTDGSGRSLYIFELDQPNVSNCSGGCALAWPPVITVNDPAPG